MIVRYARLFNLGNYENERIEIEQEVHASQTPEDVLAYLAAWVAAEGHKLHERRLRARSGEPDGEIPF
jgi:hypothetical protein